jgi:divalent metal cation (Fe/Co/Zn/Cd) transporter
MTAEHTAAIATAVEDRLRQRYPGVAEVEVHFIPTQAATPDYALTARAAADALGLATHEVRVAEVPQGKILEMHVEVPPGQTLSAAHAQVTTLEHNVRASLPDVADVVTHIEPALTTTATAPPPSAKLEHDVPAMLGKRFPGMRWHHFRVSPYDDGYAVILHVTLPAQMTVEEAHQLAEAAELLVRTEFPSIGRVTIHTEPPENQ